MMGFSKEFVDYYCLNEEAKNSLPSRSMKEEFEKRIEQIMKDFVPTPEVVKKIIELNDGLYERFKMAYEDMLMMKAMIDEDILSGRLKISGYTIAPEFFFAYDYEDGIPTVSEQMLMELSDATMYMMPSFTLYQGSHYVPDFDKAFLNEDSELNWNIEDLDLPGLEDHHIYMFMHRIFQDAGTFCVADIPYLKPADLEWQITVQYEFFNRKTDGLGTLSKQYIEDMVKRFSVALDFLKDK